MAEGLGGLGLGGDNTKGAWGQLGVEGLDGDDNDAHARQRQQMTNTAAGAAGAVPETSRWVVVYPCYINSKKSIAEGRKLSKEMCCENPLPAAMAQSAAKLGFQVAIEPRKTHPRDYVHPGRIRVRLFDEKGEPALSVKNRMELYREIAKVVPTVKIVQQQPSQRQPAAKAGGSASGSGSGASSSGKAGGKAGGKGKGKKKGKR